jgi:glycosyl hydrolase family 32
MNRRELLILGAIAGIESSLAIANKVSPPEVHGGWQKYPRGPVLGGQYGTIFDICVLREQDRFRMWVSWRPKKSVALTESNDGIHWSAPEIVLPPASETGWEDDINRPVVVHREDGYHMWYTGQANAKSKIGYAKSADGKTWTRQSSKPVLESSLPWEGVALMCPHVIWNAGERSWKMW